MASVTIELSEITSFQVVVSPGVTMEMMAADRHGTIQMDYKQSMAPGPSKCMANQVTNEQAGSSVPIGDSF